MPIPSPRSFAPKMAEIAARRSREVAHQPQREPQAERRRTARVDRGRVSRVEHRGGALAPDRLRTVDRQQDAVRVAPMRLGEKAHADRLARSGNADRRLN